jgi:hypothetical protein
VFQVELDGESQQVDSFSAVDDTCKVGYKKENLEDKQHDMVITTLGPSPQAPRPDSDGTVDIENIMYVVFYFCGLVSGSMCSQSHNAKPAACTIFGHVYRVQSE